MPEGMCWVGLEVHANGTVCAVFDGATGGVGTRRLLGRPHELLGWLGRLRQPLRAVDVAGPTGYGRARRARGRGLELRVCGPGQIARGPGGRVETDKRDALRPPACRR